MNQPLLSCSKCKSPLPADFVNQPDFAPCPSCARPLHVEAFPALFRTIERGHAGEAVLEDTEASCFYHPAKKATLPCESCGRFLCALCDCEVSGRHVCPSCVDAGRKKGKIQDLENHRTLHDSAALALAIVSIPLIVVVFFAPLTSVIAIYLSLRRWNSPTSIVHRTKIRFILAIIIALLALAGAVLYDYFIFFHANR